MTDHTVGGEGAPPLPPRPATLTPLFPVTARSRRRRLPFVIRHSLVIMLGTSVGVLASYALRKAGL